MSDRTKIIGLALGRVALGAALVAAPRAAVGAGWIGEQDAERPTSGVLLRAVGARDVAIGACTIAALRQGSALKPWLLGASFADAVDLAATVAAGKEVPGSSRLAIVAVAGTAIATQLALVRALDG